jgi:dTDP-4-amino-4,6-dideoxygalactose transaminase
MTVQTKIPCLDLKGQHAQIKDEVFAAFEEVYANTAFSGGPFVGSFETAFADFCETENAVAVNNGTNALHVALMAAGIKAGDEVIIPANTFIATAWAVSYVGATPVFVDCLKDSWQIDPNAVKSAVTDMTSAIIGVHLYGQPCDVDSLQTVATEHNLVLVEDAAQAQGARYKGKRVGGLADLGCFSFYPGKNLGACGEGGAVTTKNEVFAKHMQKLRNHGCEVRYYHDELGYNMRMGGLEGASLGIKLKYLPEWNERRKAIANRYINEITSSKITMQGQPDFSDSVFHLFVVTEDTGNKDGFIQYLNDNSIFPGLHYPVPCHLQKAYGDLGYKEGDFPNSEYLANNCVSLPMFAELTDEMVDAVITTVNAY